MEQNSLTGRMLGQYQITGVVGRGSTATVYRAYQQSLGRYVAVKVLHAHLDSPFTARFQREARAVAQLHHRGILPIYDYGEERGVPYIVTQYIAGSTTLADELARGPVEPLRALRLAAELLDALDYAHRHGVVHRDIKPSNVLLAGPEWLLLADFGIAQLAHEATSLTPPGQIVGTPAYVAPERALGGPADARADLYSTGVVLYEMLVGQLPFPAGAPGAVIAQHIHSPPPPPTLVNPALPPEVEPLVLRALEKDPARRYSSAGHMLADVRRVSAQLQRAAARRDLASLLEREVNAPPAPPPAAPSRRSYETAELDAPDVAAPTAPRWLLPAAALLLALLLVPLLLIRAAPIAPPDPTAAPNPTPAVAVAPTAAAAEPAAGAPSPAPAAPEPTPAPPPSPTSPAPTVAPPTAVPLAGGSPGAPIVLDDDRWAGGFAGAAGRRTYGGRTATWVYGQGTGYETMSAAFVLEAQPRGQARLTVEGMDAEGRARSEISVLVNDVEIFRGANPLPDDDLPLESGTWASFTWPFDAALLRPGVNEIRITNLTPGQFSLPPFVALDYAVVELAP